MNLGHTIPILPAAHTPSTACSACVHGDDGAPVCRVVLGDTCVAPRLTGPADQLQRLMMALAPVLGFEEAPGRADGAGLVRSLQWQPGEVDLQLAVGRHCGGAALADQAFQTLRDLLPDTDIFVGLDD